MSTFCIEEVSYFVKKVWQVILNEFEYASGHVNVEVLISLHSLGFNRGSIHTVGAFHILRSVCGSVATPQDPHYTGIYCEVMDEHGEPGLGNFTSMARAGANMASAWSNRYVLGTRPPEVGREE